MLRPAVRWPAAVLGEHVGPEYADPWAVARQSTNGRMAVRNDRGGDDTAGFTTWRGVRWSGVAGPFPAGMLTKRSSHLWRADLPADLAAGVHTLEVSTTDRYGRTFRASTTFEVVETIPEMGWKRRFLTVPGAAPPTGGSGCRPRIRR